MADSSASSLSSSHGTRLSEATLDEYVGIYEMKGATPRTITRDGTRLRMALVNTAGSARTVLQAHAKDSFIPIELSFNRFRFMRDAANSVTQLVRIDTGCETQVSTRIADGPASEKNRAPVGAPFALRPQDPIGERHCRPCVKLERIASAELARVA